MLPLFASLVLLTDYYKVGAVVVIIAKLVVVVESFVAEVPPRRFHDDAASRDTSVRVGIGVNKVVGVDLRHVPENINLFHHLLNVVGANLYLVCRYVCIY